MAKICVITGGTSGIGKCTAEAMAQKGYTVYELSRREEGLPGMFHIPTDVTDPDACQRAIDEVVSQAGRIDVMINNAGLMPLAPLEMLRFDEWDQCIDVNIKGVLWGIAAALPYFKDQKSGQFINVSSVAGHTISAGGAIYSATKYSVRVISEALRKEVKPYNIRTTVLSPGAVDTELPASVGAPGVNDAIADYYKNNAIPADSFARCVLFAMSQPENIDINEILFRPTVQEL